jgi:hypothetical protein
MTTVHGALFRGGTEIAAGLEIRINTMRTHGGQEEWYGSFRLPPDSELARGEYSLRLVDGRAGDIRVTFTSVFCDRTLTAQFVGESPLGNP